jgi:hypothetical protein
MLISYVVLIASVLAEHLGDKICEGRFSKSAAFKFVG